MYSLTDGDNNATVFSNWKRGTPQNVQFADASSASAVVNDAGWITSLTDETHQTTNYQYDGMGRLSHITPPADASQTWDDTTLTFNPVAQAEHGVPAGHWKQTVQTGRGSTETVFDGLWRPLLTERFDANSKAATLSQTATGYDAMGRTVFVSYPSNSIDDIAAASIGSHTQYDALDRATHIQRDSELGTLTTRRDYLPNNRVKVTDPRNHATTTQFQAYGQPETRNAINIAFADGATTTVQRDGFGSPMQMQQSGIWQGQPISVTHTFAYDAYHQLCLQTSPETGQTAFGHDAAGNLVWSAQGLSGKTDCVAEANVPATAKVGRTYDTRNRLKTIDYPAGTADESFDYELDGKLKTATRAANGSQPQSIWTILYNHRRLLTDETLTTEAKTLHIGYGYNSEGQRDSVQYPSGLSLALAPDGLGRPTQLGSYASAITYAPNGTVTDLRYGNGATLARTLNTRDLIQTTTYAFGTAFSRRTLGYDENANPNSIADRIGCARSDTIFCNGFDAPRTGSDSRAFVYDAIDRLTQMTSGRYGTDAYTYDPLGNVRANGATTWHYDAATNRVSDENGTAYGYDARGNVTSIGGFAPTWNLANEPVADSLGGGFAYDARGWRVKQTGGGHTRYFVYDANHQLIERLDNNTVTDFITIGSLPIARTSNGVATYIHPDYQNTPLFETSSSGAITRNPDYLAYGQPVDAQGTAEIPGYTGAAPDKDTGLLYLGARYLRAPRFLSVDPEGLDPTSPMGLNRYAYANDNPARYTDPTGRCVDADFGCGAMGRSIAAQPETYNAVGPYAGAAAGALAVAPLAYGLGVAALANPVAATNIVNGAAEALAGDALGGSSLVVGGAAAAKGADTIADGMRISTNRLTGSGETFIRYESANPAFSKVTESGGVKPGTFAAPASDGIVPTAERVSVYNLPSPEIPRPNAIILKPPPGTPIIGPRPVVGGTGNEVIFPFGYKP